MHEYSISMPPLFCKSSERSTVPRVESIPIFQRVLLTKTSQTENSSLPVKKICLNAISIFLFNMVDKKGFLASGARARAQRVLHAVAKHFALEEDQTIPAPVAKRSLWLSAPRRSRRPRVRPSTKRSRLYLELAFTLPSQESRRPNFPYGHKTILFVSESANPSGTEPAKSRSARSGEKEVHPLGNRK